MQTKVAAEPAENGRDSVGDPTRDSVVDLVGGRGGNLTRGTQLQPQQNRNLTGGVKLQPQQDVDAMKVDVFEVSNPHIVEVIADSTTANRADDLSDSDSDSEIRARVAYLKKKKEKAKLRAELEHLKCEMAGGFVDERHQIDSNKHAYQLSLKCSKRVQDSDIYLALLQCKLIVYLSQVNNVFRQKPITYLIKMDKVLFAANYLAGIIRNK